jgi:probable HAF family extracellular repeat protein
MSARNIVSLALAVFVLLGVVALQPVASQVNPSYTVVELGGLNVDSIRVARKISASGQVAGRAGYITGSNTRAVLWLSSGTEVLGTLTGGDYSGAFALNDLGQVVGTSNTANVVRAFLWTSDRGMVDLGTLPQDNGSEAFDINNHGQVVGTSSGPQGIRAVLWRNDGTIQGLGTLPGGDSSRAFAINESGQVVGTSTSSAGIRAFLWTSNGGMQSLGTLPGDTSSEALDINNAAQVVGYSTGPQGTRAFLWTSDGGMQNLGTLTGGNYSRAFAINNLGQIVGTSNSPNGMRAVLWTAPGVLLNLNLLISGLGPDLVLSEAHCINDLGQIAALSGGGEQAPTAAGDNHDQEHFYRVFLLTPTQTVSSASTKNTVRSPAFRISRVAKGY